GDELVFGGGAGIAGGVDGVDVEHVEVDRGRRDDNGGGRAAGNGNEGAATERAELGGADIGRSHVDGVDVAGRCGAAGGGGGGGGGWAGRVGGGGRGGRWWR